MSGLTRTFAIDDLTPAELAEVFTDMSGGDQADFFSAVWDISRSWPGAGWCQQSYAIARFLTSDGREAIRVLASHALADDAA